MFTNCKLLFVLNLKRVVTDNTEDIFITMGKHDQLCTSECKHGGSDKGDMIRCCLCANWFHEDCLDLKKHDREGVWSCPSCHQLSKHMEELVSTFDSLKSMMTVFIQISDKTHSEGNRL